MKNLINGGWTANKRRKVTIPVITAMALLAGGLLFSSGKGSTNGEVDALRLANEEILGEKLQLEKQLAELERQHAHSKERAFEADQRALDLERRLAAAGQTKRTGTNDNQTGAGRRMKSELAEALEARERLSRELDGARDGQRSLQDQLNMLRADRDALAARLGQLQQSARMVNNASVDAVRGKRKHLTVRARRTNEIRMAFDLPEEVARNANFKIVSPSGRTFEGGNPALSLLPGEGHDGALAARFMLAGDNGQDRAARVHLLFKPEMRLEPGTYRIDICSGELYLNTVMLNLR